jgi:hypothetical protein
VCVCAWHFELWCQCDARAAIRDVAYRELVRENAADATSLHCCPPADKDANTHAHNSPGRVEFRKFQSRTPCRLRHLPVTSRSPSPCNLHALSAHPHPHTNTPRPHARLHAPEHLSTYARTSGLGELCFYCHMLHADVLSNTTPCIALRPRIHSPCWQLAPLHKHLACVPHKRELACVWSVVLASEQAPFLPPVMRQSVCLFAMCPLQRGILDCTCIACGVQ